MKARKKKREEVKITTFWQKQLQAKAIEVGSIFTLVGDAGIWTFPPIFPNFLFFFLAKKKRENV